MRALHFILCLTCLAAAGCATGRQESPLTAAQVVQHDLSTGGETATILLKARPAGQQQLVSFYQVNFNGLDPILIFKDSNAAIRLDAGTHTMTIQAVIGRDKSKARDKFFGEPAVRTIRLEKDQRMILEYVGPYWMREAGRLSEK